MKIVERIVGDITIFDLKGKVTLGEGDETLKARLARLITGGRRKLIVNLEAVPYIDSSGNGELVRAYTTLSRAGGRMVLLNLTERIEDLLSITKLLTVYETYESEAQAIRSFDSVGRTSRCSICGLQSGFGTTREIQKCANCLAISTLRPGERDDERLVERVVLPTYEGEKVVLLAQWPYVIGVMSRLDLFSAEVVEQAWLAIPRPRRVLIEIPVDTPLLTPKGVKVVASLCRPEADGGRTAVWCTRSGHDDASFLADRSSAVEALLLTDAAPTRMAVEVGTLVVR